MGYVGRPAVFKTPEELDAKVDEYFASIRSVEPATITGLVLFLGFANRQSLTDYEKKPEYSDIIKNARCRVEHEYEKLLFQDKPTGPIFALKNMGWADRSEVDLTTLGKEINKVATATLPDGTTLEL